MENAMLFSLLPLGYFGPANWKILIIVLIVAVIVVSLFSYLLVHAARVAIGDYGSRSSQAIFGKIYLHPRARCPKIGDIADQNHGIDRF